MPTSVRNNREGIVTVSFGPALLRELDQFVDTQRNPGGRSAVVAAAVKEYMKERGKGGVG